MYRYTYNSIILHLREKHPVKVHVWAGISHRGHTGIICIFDGKMDAVLYVDIIRQTLLPFLDTIYPDGHHLMQGNDPKHTSNHCKDYFKKTPLNRRT